MIDREKKMNLVVNELFNLIFWFYELKGKEVLELSHMNFIKNILNNRKITIDKPHSMHIGPT